MHLAFWKKKKDDPFGDGDMGKDPFGSSQSDPFANQNSGQDPFGSPPGMGHNDPFSNPSSQGGSFNALSQPGDPFASPGFNSSQPSPFAQSQSPSIPSSGSMRTPTLEPVRQQESSPEYSHQQFIINKDIEVLSSKMDAIRASLDSLNQRLANIERLAYGEYDRQKRSQW